MPNELVCCLVVVQHKCGNHVMYDSEQGFEHETVAWVVGKDVVHRLNKCCKYLIYSRSKFLNFLFDSKQLSEWEIVTSGVNNRMRLNVHFFIREYTKIVKKCGEVIELPVRDLHNYNTDFLEIGEDLIPKHIYLPNVKCNNHIG